MKKIIKMEITLEKGKYWIIFYLKNGYKEWHGFTELKDLNKFIIYYTFYLKEE